MSCWLDSAAGKPTADQLCLHHWVSQQLEPRPRGAQMIQLLDKQGINTIILSKKYHHDLLRLCPLPFIPLCKAVLKIRPWLVFWRGMFDMVRWITGFGVGATFGQDTAGKEAAEPPRRCWALMHGQKPCPSPAFWLAQPERACSHSSVLGTGWGQPKEECTSAPRLLWDPKRTGGDVGGRLAWSGVPQHPLIPVWTKPSWGVGQGPVGSGSFPLPPQPLSLCKQQLESAQSWNSVSGNLKTVWCTCPFADSVHQGPILSFELSWPWKTYFAGK